MDELHCITRAGEDEDARARLAEHAPLSSEDCQTVAGWLKEWGGVAFTGAGVSTESGIPDFRSPGGVWSRYQPVDYRDFLASASARHEYWRQKAEGQADFTSAEPNAGHRALARLEAAGLLEAVITQNIDGLHQQAGSQRVLELHGTARQVACLDCQARFDAPPFVEQFRETGAVPVCPACGSQLLKHATISFGQGLPPDVLQQAFALCKRARVVLALGSSLVVEPAASLPRTAVEYGARLVIVNRDPTPLDERAAIVLRTSLGETLAALADAVGA